MVVEQDRLAEGLGLAEEGVHDVGADHRHRPRGVDVVGDELAAGDEVPHRADAAEVLGDAHDLHVGLLGAAVLHGAGDLHQGPHLPASVAGRAKIRRRATISCGGPGSPIVR